MNLLKDGVAMGLVVPTELSRKLTVDGITQAYPLRKLSYSGTRVTKKLTERNRNPFGVSEKNL